MGPWDCFIHSSLLGFVRGLPYRPQHTHGFNNHPAPFYKIFDSTHISYLWVISSWMSHIASATQCATRWIHHSFSGNLLEWQPTSPKPWHAFKEPLFTPHQINHDILPFGSRIHAFLILPTLQYSPSPHPSPVPPLWISAIVSFPRFYAQALTITMSLSHQF